jgi:hypothetical protein
MWVLKVLVEQRHGFVMMMTMMMMMMDDDEEEWDSVGQL